MKKIHKVHLREVLFNMKIDSHMHKQSRPHSIVCGHTLLLNKVAASLVTFHHLPVSAYPHVTSNQYPEVISLFQIH